MVVGGGPAGSVAGALLARQGFDVALFEAEVFPRAHVGESLLPATLAVLDDIGVLPAVASAGFVEKWGATMSWGRDPAPWSWYFKETNRRFPHAYQVWRPKFDQILLDHAAACGCAVHCGEAVTAVDRGTVTLAGGGHVEAGMVVDASGQRALVATARGLRKWDSAFRNLAVYGYFDGGRHLDPPDDGNIFIEATAHGWLWKIPLAGGVSSVGAVVDRDYGAGEIRRAGLEDFFSDQIASGTGTHNFLDGAVKRQGLTAVRDWSYCAKSMVGDDFALVGDAACFIDPLFSTGVHLAVSGAHLAAAYVTTALSTPSLRAAAGAAYERLYASQYAHFRELAKLFYASNRTADSYFWEARRITGTPADAPRAAFVRAVSGQTAAGYERSVLRHGVLPKSFQRALDAETEARHARRMRPVASTRVRRASGVAVRQDMVLGDGRFEPGYVIDGPGRDELPVSGLVASLAHYAEGKDLGAIAERIASANEADPARVAEAVLAAAELLIADGLLEVEEPGG
ncbi:MAG: tryptophan 7-halogenase [Gammaproteobacteria bacterium]|nr:tryptophan 7-halogenase [Gammaproteobacteria bacterium]